MKAVICGGALIFFHQSRSSTMLQTADEILRRVLNPLVGVDLLFVLQYKRDTDSPSNVECSIFDNFVVRSVTPMEATDVSRLSENSISAQQVHVALHIALPPIGQYWTELDNDDRTSHLHL